jgi:hypothetical protein
MMAAKAQLLADVIEKNHLFPTKILENKEREDSSLQITVS